MWVAEHPCCDEDGASGFVQSHIWLSNEQFTLPEQRWVFLYMGQHSSEMKVACLPVVWCHAFRICIHMPTAYILLHLPGRAAGGICLSVSVLSFPVPLCWLIMKEKCNIQIKSWLGWYFREKWHLPSLNTVCTLKFYLIWITWRMMNRRQNLFCWGICVCLLIVNSLWLLK